MGRCPFFLLGLRKVLKKKGRAGFGLMETLVSLSLSMIVMYGVLSMIQMQNRESRSLAEKLAILDLEKSVISSLTNFSVCSFMINQGPGYSLDTTAIGTSAPPVFTIPKVFAGNTTTSLVLAETGQPISPYIKSVVPTSIRVANIKDSGVPNAYSGDLMIQYDDSLLVRPVKPTRVRVTIRTTGVVNPYPVIGCTGGSSISSGMFCNTWNEDPPGPNSYGCTSPDNGFCHIPNSEEAAMCVIGSMDDDTAAFLYPYTSNGRVYVSAAVPAGLYQSPKCQISTDPAGGWRFRAYHNCGMVNCVYTCLFL